MTTAQPSNTRTIGSNSFWYAFEAIGTTIVMLIASVPVARIMGPQILGQYIYLVFLTNIAQRVGNLGVPATACKYMSEYIGRGETGIAKEIFHRTLTYQALIATAVTAIGIGLVFLLGDAQERTIAFILVLSIWPGMVNNIPAQANVASENLRLNIPASFTNFISYAILVVLTLLFGWGIIGLAIATFASRTLEALVRYVGVRRRLQAFERRPIPSDLKRRMFTFSQQNLFLLALGLVVWDRSELLFLKHYSGATEVAFYSLAFSITNQLLMAPRAFSSSIGVTIFAQYGRDASRLDGLMRNATRYVGLLTIPLFLGLAAIADPLIRTVYGPKYLPVIPVLALMSVFALPRGFQSHIENLLQAHETQGFMVRWLSFVGVLNLLLDWLLIPSHGALGAAVANGVAQSVAIAGVWVKATSVVHLNPPVHFWRRIGLSGIAIVVVVLPLQRLMPASAALIVGVMAGAVAFAATVRMTHCLEAEDFVRFRDLSARMPAALQPVCMSVLTMLIPRAKPQLPEPANIL